MKNLFLLLALTPVFFACGGSKSEPMEAKPAMAIEQEIPIWITSPHVEGGIAATRCVSASKSMSIDQSQTTALARAELARQIEVRAQVMDKTYQEKITTSKGDSIGSTFSEVSKQVAEAKLSGTRAYKASYVTLNDQRMFCTMVGMDPKVTNEILEDLVNQSGVSKEVSPQDKEVLYQEFKAYKAQQELEEALAN